MANWINTILLVLIAILEYGSVEGITENCESVEVMKCLTTTTQAANDGRLFFPDNQQKLREYCKHLMEGLDCARRIIDECVGDEDKNIYYNLTHDMVGMNVELCTPGSSLSTRFLKHVDCYKNLSEKFRVCSERYISNIFVVQSLSQEEQMKMTCCTVHEYSRCMRNAVEGRCDSDAQKLVEDTVITALKQSFSYCSQLPSIATSNCLRSFSASKGHATDTLEEDGSGIIHASVSLTVFLLLIYAILVS